MRALTFALCLPVFALSLSQTASADDDRTATYGGSAAKAETVVKKRVRPSGETELQVGTKTSSNNPVEVVRQDFGYTSDEELKQESEAAVLDGRDFTTRTTEQRRDSVPRVQELGF